MIHKLLVGLLLVVPTVAKFTPPKVANLKKIRVRIAKQQQDITISGTDLSRYFYPTGKGKRFAGRKKIKFNCSSISKKNKFKRPIRLASLVSSTGLISYKGKKYRGSLKVVMNKNLKSCDVINQVNLESYISTLLSKEMNASWPIEALKAQAVAARTYAIDKIRKARAIPYSFYDLENSEKHQVNGDFFDATARTLRAARETAGIVLTNTRGNLVPAFFHASCGGSTLQPHEVWSNKVYGYATANCNYCKKKENWQNILTRKRFKKFLEWGVSRKYLKNVALDGEIIIYPDKKSRKKVALSIGKTRLKIRKALFRRYFGRVMFPSNNFYIISGLLNGNVSVVGKGNGHGVGMCQVGSKGLAHKGKGHKEILAHYYPKFNLKKYY